MTPAHTIDKSLRERRRITRLLDFLKRDDLTGEQMERIGRRLQKSGKRALSPLVRKLWREQNGTAIYRYTCMLDFFDASAWMDQLIQITLQRKDLEEDGKLALLVSIAVVYKATKVSRVSAGSFLKESALLFGSILVFMVITALVLMAVAWFVVG